MSAPRLAATADTAPSAPQIQPIYRSAMTTMLERLKDAANAHDAQRLASLCAEDYHSVQPLHPNRGFGGGAQVLENWSSVFDGVPDFSAELVASSMDGGIEWGEWHWHGHHVDGSPFAMRGVTIFVVRDGLIAEGRLYMEPVEAGGEDIEAAVQELYKPPAESTH
jgi:ketosteroid isomerase-like protein